MRTNAVTRLAFPYGFFVLIMACICGSCGHGTYVAVGVTSAPLSLIGVPIGVSSVKLSAFGYGFALGPFFWKLMGFAATKRDSPRLRLLFPAVAGLHYLSAIVAVTATGAYSDWEQIPPVLGFFILWLLAYVFGQIALWRGYLERPRA